MRNFRILKSKAINKSKKEHIKRSKKNITCPIVVATIENNKAHCIAVSPMFIDFYLEFKNNGFNGIWLHDFNVKGIPEKDNYWEPRKINGSKI